MGANYHIAIQMDPLESLNLAGDSTYALMLEANKRGFNLFFYEPRHLSYDRDRGVEMTGHTITLQPEKDWPFTLGDKETRKIDEFDIILIRQDPPFDLAYLTTTWLLELAPKKTLVVNDPRAIRDSPEKLLITHFPELIPPTLISRDLEEIRAFRAKHKEIIIKPLFGNGGAGIFYLKEQDANLLSLLEQFEAHSNEPLMIQAFLLEVGNGDKRIILADGEPVGVINRVAAAGEVRSNMHVGGKAVPTDYNDRDLEICRTIAPILKQRGLIFAGIDVIGDYLTEINVTSPTGLQEAARFTGIHPEVALWDAILKRFHERIV